MEYFKDLFLQAQENPTVEVNSEEHIFRSKHAKDDFVITPLFPKLNKSEATIDRIWKDTVEQHKEKRVFGNRDIIKVKKISCKT